ncbi:nitroreductase family protein [Sporolactobacillus sp. CPB3-1]|uniref:Nitroreductase family protein n=1 Tax=Sporolactobacillus mangiferae TaxID=2940498 RepID=A0ABT0M9Q5_9BACL|nr:nitroreductase family protein [Sporolactobacillus mangiferae]MCL1631597.1 nitroreductase family protein [Sporolactobacillus mangiferae]
MKNNDKKIVADQLKNEIYDRSMFNYVEKFHQKTAWVTPFNWTFKESVFDWQRLLEYTDELPDNYISKVELPIDKDIPCFDGPRSTRIYNKEATISKKKFSDILFNAFGRYRGLGSKNYPSGGGLYPIIPMLILLEGSAIEGVENPGIYVYDSSKLELLLIKRINNKNKQNILVNVNSINPGFALSNIAFIYVIDMERALIKYGVRGYRHACIEIGLAMESLIMAYRNIDSSLGDCVWSGFNDNALTVACGLNVRLTPIGMLQWFGKRKEV